MKYYNYILFIILLFLCLFILYEFLLYYVDSKKIYFYKNSNILLYEKYNKIDLYKKKITDKLSLYLINKISNINNTQLYFIGSILRDDFIEYNEDIDILIFSNNSEKIFNKLKKYLNKFKKNNNLPNNIKLMKFNTHRKYCNTNIYGNIITLICKNIKLQISIYNIKYKYMMMHYYFSFDHSLLKYQIYLLYFLKLLKNKILNHTNYQIIKNYIFKINQVKNYYFYIDKQNYIDLKI